MKKKTASEKLKVFWVVALLSIFSNLSFHTVVWARGVFLFRNEYVQIQQGNNHDCHFEFELNTQTHLHITSSDHRGVFVRARAHSFFVKILNYDKVIALISNLPAFLLATIHTIHLNCEECRMWRSLSIHWQVSQDDWIECIDVYIPVRNGNGNIFWANMLNDRNLRRRRRRRRRKYDGIFWECSQIESETRVWKIFSIRCCCCISMMYDTPF